MQKRKKTIRPSEGLTLVETLLAVAIMAIIFAALVPQFRLIQNSWDTQAGASETLQNGRILIDHINHTLSKATRITAVSGSSETNGYIEFIDNDANNVRYDIGPNKYVEFGPVKNLHDLAGPVSQLLFTCYDGNDFTTPITDVNSIRFIKVQTTLTNPAKLDQDMTFSTQAYIRTNAFSAMGGDISKMSEPWLEYDTSQGMEPALCQIDATHYLCAYRGYGDDGFAVVLTVNTSNWTVSKGPAYEFDKKKGATPALVKIDQSHYLCAYQGDGDDGWVVPLVVNTGDWSIYEQDPLEFDTSYAISPALQKIDATHYLCTYTGPGDDGWAVVFTINTMSWTISKSTPFEFDSSQGFEPALSQIDSTHYLCAYTGPGDDGWATVLTVNTGNWTISKELPFEFDNSDGQEPALATIDETHYLCAYRDATLGRATVLTVDTGTWTITKQTPYQYDLIGMTPALSNVDDTHYLCAYTRLSSDGWSVVLNVDTGTWTVSKGTLFEFDVVTGNSPTLATIDDSHYLCVYSGPGDDGFAGVLTLSELILP